MGQARRFKEFGFFLETNYDPYTNLAENWIFKWEAEMTNANKYLALTALGFFMTGCTGLTKNQAALVGASVCGVGGAAAGA